MANQNRKQRNQLQQGGSAAGGNAAGGKKQRMAGEVWRSYDAASRGGGKFDNKDIKHLVKEGWSNNNILKAAAAADRVSSGADRQLGALGTMDSKFSPLKKGGYHRDVQWTAATQGKESVRFLGGDPEKGKNWITSYGNKDKAGDTGGLYGSLGGDDGRVWANPGQHMSDERGKQRDVLRWNGVDGDGRGLALSGVRIRGDDSKFDKDNQRVSWSLPKDFIAERDQAAFNKQMEAYKAANPEPEAKLETPAEKPAPFDPSAFRSQIDGLMSAVNQLKSSSSSGTGSGSSSGSSGSSSGNDTTVTPVAPVTPVGQNDNGDFLGGFESIINKRYGRPMDWMGDVWKQ